MTAPQLCNAWMFVFFLTSAYFVIFFVVLSWQKKLCLWEVLYFCLVMLSPKTPLVGERWDYQVLELDQKFKLQMVENLKGHLVRHLASDQYFPTETLRRGKMRGNSDLKTVCKCMLVVSLLSFFSFDINRSARST